MDSTIEEITSEFKSHSCKQILKDCSAEMSNASNDSYPAYIYVEPTPITSSYIKQITRLYLTRQMINTLLLKINALVSYKLQIEAIHSLRTMKDEDDVAFISLDKCTNNRFHPEPNFYITDMPQSPYWTDNSSRFQKSRYEQDRFTEIILPIGPDTIYLRSDSKVIANIKKSADYTLDDLNTNDKKALKSLLEIVGIDRIKSLSQILDPSWKHKSSELHTIIELQEQVLIKGYGNQSYTVKGRMYQYLHDKNPSQHPLPYPQANEKDFRAPTRRLATSANPDN